MELEDRGVPLLPLPPLFLPPADVSTCFGRFFFELYGRVLAPWCRLLWYQRPGVAYVLYMGGGGGWGMVRGWGVRRRGWWRKVVGGDREIGTSGGIIWRRRMEEEERGVGEEVSVWWGAHASKETMRCVPASGGGRGGVGRGGDVAAAGKHKRAQRQKGLGGVTPGTHTHVLGTRQQHSRRVRGQTSMVRVCVCGGGGTMGAAGCSRSRAGRAGEGDDGGARWWKSNCCASLTYRWPPRRAARSGTWGIGRPFCRWRQRGCWGEGMGCGWGVGGGQWRAKRVRGCNDENGLTMRRMHTPRSLWRTELLATGPER